MALQPIVTIPHRVLRTPAASLATTDLKSPDLQKLITDLEETLVRADGIGLAAPQIGVSWRVFIVATKDGPIAFVNPKITKQSFLKIVMEEGCLSIPGVFGTVRRPRRVRLEALDRYGQPVTTDAEGLFARVIQHELDHLNGILFVDKVVRITRGEKPTNA